MARAFASFQKGMLTEAVSGAAGGGRASRAEIRAVVFRENRAAVIFEDLERREGGVAEIVDDVRLPRVRRVRDRDRAHAKSILKLCSATIVQLISRDSRVFRLAVI